MKPTRLLAGLLALGAAGFAPVAAPAPAPPQAPQRILFIGNSLTYMQAMPQLLRGLAQAGGITIEVEQHAPGGARLVQHATNPQVRALLGRGGWYAVVLQEQSQWPGFSDDQTRREIDPYVAQLAQLARSAPGGARTRIVLYQTPARRNGDPGNAGNIPELGTYQGMQRRINATYQRLAGNVSGTVVPAGTAWQMARRERPDINLYGDETHPNREGAYLIACVFYARLWLRNPAGSSFTGGVEPRVAAALQAIAWRAAQAERSR